MSRKRTQPNGGGRHALLLFCFLAAFVLISVRLVWVQVVQAPALTRQATAQRLRDIELPPRRGTIYDREGEPLAVSTAARTVFASPNLIKDKVGTARALASSLGGDEKAYLAKLKKDSGFVYIDRKVDLARAAELEKLELKGVGFTDDFSRVYPSGELACQSLGFVGVDDHGLSGLEAEYDELLAGRPGVVLGERDPQGRPIPGGIQKAFDPVHGKDVVLTIDKDIQYQAQIEIGEAVQKWGAKSGTVVIMNPKNGELYAIASAPGFDPNNYGKAKPQSIRNRPITDAYEPGSTMKCLTASAVIDRGLYTPKTKFSLPSTIRVGDRTIHESHGRGAVRWTLTQIVTNSSNVGTVKLGLKLGKRGLYDSFSAFGLTEKTGVDFPGETTGWLPSPESWSPSSIGNIPFGQGVSVTPLQLVRAIGAIANGGELTTPHFLLDVPSDSASVPTWPKRRAISAKTSESVTKILQAVVTEGTGKEARVRGYAVAGKTGTAQKANPNGGGYGGGRYVGSFIGFLPAEDPQVVVSVILDEPTKGIYGGAVAAPTFSKLGRFTVAHLKIPPSSTYQVDSLKTTEKTPTKAGVGPVSDQGARD